MTHQSLQAFLIITTITAITTIQVVHGQSPQLRLVAAPGTLALQLRRFQEALRAKRETFDLQGPTDDCAAAVTAGVLWKLENGAKTMGKMLLNDG